MFGEVLGKVLQEKDLGVVVSNDLKTTKEGVAAAQKADTVLGFISGMV